ncbi:MAG: putative coat protein [Coniothyrium diplodiella chrysovirus 1]|uniref:putative coat protein n=1 Tax=Coniothyrium diplodiella chrysovirus 1 TaxID=2587540 RepID=UPI001BE5F99A|nr:MAG: putative coat protein [Coniothyrium diplodiella chrysovirus 1]QDB74972.1 MAG: putative coat protein [Coniothyrium diplodiella chrysovirus 1]
MENSEIFSFLKMHGSMGMPDSLLADKNSSEPKEQRLDMTELVLNKSLAEELLSPAMWGLFNQVGASGSGPVVMTYSLDRRHGDVTTPALSKVSVPYESVPKTARAYVYYEGKVANAYVSSMIEGESSLSSYAKTVRGPVLLGHGVEAAHLRMERRGCEIRALMVRMWMLHLDVVSGSELKIPVDHIRAHKSLISCRDVEEECDYAKTVRGVRVHVNAMDNTGRALLMASAGQSDVQGMSTRASRYTWPKVNVTLYGGMLPRSFDMTLTDASVTARAIVSFADAYGQREECGTALQTALMLYGTHLTPSKLVLKLPLPDVHQHTHQARVMRPELKRCRELASPGMVGVALFAGLGWAQAASHTLRATLMGMGVNDVDGAKEYFVRTHETLVHKAARQLALVGCAKNYYTYVNDEEYLRRLVKPLWATRGVMHALSMGLVIKNSLIEQVTMPIMLTTHLDTDLTDAPDQGSKHKEALGKWMLASALRRSGGQELCCSLWALADDVRDNTRIHSDIQLHAGNEVQFRLVSIGDEISVHTLIKSGFGFQPPLPAEDIADTFEANNVLVSDMKRAPDAQKAADWVDDLLALRGPAATTTLRKRPNTYNAKPATIDTSVANVEVREVAPDATQTFAQIAARTWGVVPTSGEGLMCGARALKLSMDALHAAENLPAPPFDEVVDVLTGAIVTDDERERAEAAGVHLDTNNFTVDQMSIAAQRMGYRLGVIDSDVNGSHRVWLNPAEGSTDGDPVLYVHNEHGHWSGIGPSDRPIRSVDTPA